MSPKRNQRALSAIRALRAKHKKQHRQIDILCKDMVQLHGQFAGKLSRTSFLVSFYETLLGSADLESLLDSAAAAIGARCAGASVAIVLLENKGYDIHFVPSKNEKHLEANQLKEWFTPESVQNISMAGQVCFMEKMLAVGLAAPPSAVRKINAAAIPMMTLGKPAGLIFLCKKAGEHFMREELELLAAAASGLRIAVSRFQKSVQSYTTTVIK